MVSFPSLFSMNDEFFCSSCYVLCRGCYFQEGKEVKMGMKIEDAYQRSLETVMHWIGNELNSKKTKIFFRTFAPVHFRYVSSLFSGKSQHLK